MGISIKIAMDKNEIKKSLYKQKPTAYAYGIDAKDNCCYHTSLDDGTSITFTIPPNECEDFEDEMPAQLLIRWIDDRTKSKKS